MAYFLIGEFQIQSATMEQWNHGNDVPPFIPIFHHAPKFQGGVQIVPPLEGVPPCARRGESNS